MPPGLHLWHHSARRLLTEDERCYPVMSTFLRESVIAGNCLCDKIKYRRNGVKDAREVRCTSHLYVNEAWMVDGSG